MSSQKSAICNLKSKIVVGLVGGIGSGKSSVAAAFAERGARVVSGDRAGHEALRQQEIRQRVVERFGPGVLDAAIMIEAGWNRICDKLIFVDAPRPLRLRRLAAQRGWSAKEVETREAAQMPVDEKAKRADHVIDNSGSPEHVAAQLDDLMRQWTSKQ